MPRGRPKKNQPSQAETLEAALEFVSVAETDVTEFSQFVRLENKMAIVFSSQISAGHPIEEELTLSPNLSQLRAALKRCGKQLLITETEGKQLSIKGDKIRALIPSWNDALVLPVPDKVLLEGDYEMLKEAFKVCGTLANEAGEKVHLASLLLGPNTCTGTNGAAIIQYWHGYPMPPGTVVSKLFAAAVAKQTKKIVGLGGEYNAELGYCTSFTVWFEGGAWIRTQCYQDRWPDLVPILDRPNAAIDTPEGLFEAIDAVTFFTDKHNIYFKDDSVQSHDIPTTGAQYEVKGLQGGKQINGKLVKQISPWAKKIDLTSYDDRVFFFGGEVANPVRGCFMVMK